MMKYLRRTDFDLGPQFVAFTGSTSHEDMARMMGWPRAEIVSAGFISLTSAGLYCHGESQSLGIASLVSDSKLATAFFK